MYSREIKERLQSMTIEEKARLCAGKDFWQTWGDEESGIPPMLMTDGPSGLRKQTEATDHLGLNESNTAVCFPAGSGGSGRYRDWKTGQSGKRWCGIRTVH